MLPKGRYHPLNWRGHWLWSRDCFKILPFAVMHRVARVRQRQLGYLWLFVLHTTTGLVSCRRGIKSPFLFVNPIPFSLYLTHFFFTYVCRIILICSFTTVVFYNSLTLSLAGLKTHLFHTNLDRSINQSFAMALQSDVQRSITIDSLLHSWLPAQLYLLSKSFLY